jgi:hypothetical protein
VGVGQEVRFVLEELGRIDQVGQVDHARVDQKVGEVEEVLEERMFDLAQAVLGVLVEEQAELVESGVLVSL